MRPPNGIREAPVDLENVSLILRTDSYKVTHWLQLPPNTRNIYEYAEPRGGVYSDVTFFGLQPILMNYLMRPVTAADVDYAEALFNEHFFGVKLFNRTDWDIIVKEYGGYMPIRIKAIPEGTTVPTRNVVFTVESTDDRLAWAAGYVEGVLMKVWYPTTVATIARNIRKLILRYLEETGTPDALDYKLHDFGYRGVSSEMSAGIGGLAHLSTGNKGSDTLIAIEAGRRYYNEWMAANSIPAAEHGTILAWGREHETDAFENCIKKFGTAPFYAVVSDTYDIFNATDVIWGQELKGQVLAAPGMLVVRPDSGIPNEVVRQVVEILGRRFGYTVNEKGFKVLNKVRVIQGDGIDEGEIGRILEALKIRGWSADNVAFGMGGALLQKMDRDTQKWAIKMSQVTVGFSVRDVFKSPVGDNTKRSKAGRLKLVQTENGLETHTLNDPTEGHDLLHLVYENGYLYNLTTLKDVRARAAL